MLACTLSLMLGATLLGVAPTVEARADGVTCYDSFTPPRNRVVRMAGADRYATAVAVTRASFTTSRSCEVLVASGTNFPDALAGAAKASGYVVPEPVLLVRPGSIPESVKSELRRMRPLWINVVGGRAAISDDVVRQLEGFAEHGVIRSAGADRYATAAYLAQSFATDEVVYIASGENFPDALAGAPLAGRTYSPVLLVKRNSIPESVRTQLVDLRPSRIVILGGTGAVSGDVAGVLKSYTRGTVTRISGADRFATSVAISKAFAGPIATRVFVASGRSYPDALAGAPAAAQDDTSVLLVERDSIPPVVARELERLRPAEIVVLGGTGVVSEKVAKQLEAYVVPAD